MDEMALISDIQQFCTYDGPGIRTVVFFKGCPLRCKWCQNPEDLEIKKNLLFNQEKCTGCGQCITQCKKNALSFTNGKMTVNRQRCIACGTCIETCGYDAKSICGNKMTVNEIFREVMRDEVFFRNTGGGVTFSGGECTLYPRFMIQLLQQFREKKVHTAIETCGYCNPEIFTEIAEKVDLFLFDYKIDSHELHEKWTGQKNDLIQENLEYLIKKQKHIIIRIPLIIGVNDGAEFERMMFTLKQYRETIQEIHIMPFHQAGSSKYALSGKEYSMQEWKECTFGQAEIYAKIARDYGFKVNIGGWDFQTCRRESD